MCGRQIGKTESGRERAFRTSWETAKAGGGVDQIVSPLHRLAKKPWRDLSFTAKTSGLGTPNASEREITWDFGTGDPAIMQFVTAKDPGNIVSETISTCMHIEEPGLLHPDTWDYATPMWARFDCFTEGLGSPRGKNRFYSEYLRGLDEDGASPLISGKPPVDPQYISIQLPSRVAPWWTPERIEAARRRMSPAMFDQEINGNPQEGAACPFDNYERYSDQAREAPVNGGIYVIGVDLAKHHDWTCGSVMRLDGCTYPIVAREVDSFRMQKQPWPVQKAKIKSQAAIWNNALIVLDATGIGDPIFDDLASMGVEVEPFKFTESSKPMLVEHGITQVSTGQCRLLSKEADPVAYQEMGDFQQEVVVPKGRMTSAEVSFRYGHPEGTDEWGNAYHDDTVMARCLALYGVNKRAARVIDYVPVA